MSLNSCTYPSDKKHSHLHFQLSTDTYKPLKSSPTYNLYFSDPPPSLFPQKFEVTFH